jgi:2'-5' RNA ligase
LEDATQVQHRRRTLLDPLQPGCLAAAPNQPHVTLAALGTDPAAAGRAHDVLGGHLAVSIGGADAFASAVFLHVGGRRLAFLREAVLAGVGSEEDPADRWIPHVTVGTFRQAVPASELRARLRPWRHLPPVTATGRTTVMAVDRLSRTGGMLPVEFRP